jgi:hypothetical protein
MTAILRVLRSAQATVLCLLAVDYDCLLMITCEQHAVQRPSQRTLPRASSGSEGASNDTHSLYAHKGVQHPHLSPRGHGTWPDLQKHACNIGPYSNLLTWRVRLVASSEVSGIRQEEIVVRFVCTAEQWGHDVLSHCRSAVTGGVAHVRFGCMNSASRWLRTVAACSVATTRLGALDGSTRNSNGSRETPAASASQRCNKAGCNVLTGTQW